MVEESNVCGLVSDARGSVKSAHARSHFAVIIRVEFLAQARLREMGELRLRHESLDPFDHRELKTGVSTPWGQSGLVDVNHDVLCMPQGTLAGHLFLIVR